MPSEILNNIKGKRADQKQIHLGRQENTVHERVALKSVWPKTMQLLTSSDKIYTVNSRNVIVSNMFMRQQAHFQALCHDSIRT